MVVANCSRLSSKVFLVMNNGGVDERTLRVTSNDSACFEDDKDSASPYLTNSESAGCLPNFKSEELQNVCNSSQSANL